ncbi:small GTP-binding protein [Paenibacillus phyllosphaerae]|uniref:Small GTP-binding protein n=1 Tax=Paenibacillus phyllosphaerae TaxID=274593 RepID=A0A7W5AZ81_9BACL|nr:TetM/TetW/TetO/TetS family tetracycline resistance ribosomal protection protein [Paenibacillus phyllosphaerae]MBB3110811.1 small GTP-binding protein [Paenibacillus phyllosphaerae]
MYTTIGMFAHVDAGKTTFAEQLLYHTNSIQKRGRVDHKDAFLDSHEVERERGITVFADQAVMTYNGNTYTLIDTPGHVDFSPEMERAIAVMDYAVLVVSAVEGVQGHTETVWQLLRKANVPTLIFINKIDRTGADAGRVLAEIWQALSEDVVDMTGITSEQEGAAQWPEERIAFIAERDEMLLERYMEEAFDEQLWRARMRTMVKEGRLFPCMSGSALQDVGVLPFLALLDDLSETDYDPNTEFGGRVYKIRHDDNGTRITFVKLTSGRMRVRDELEYRFQGETLTEKVTQLRLYNGAKFAAVDEVQAGQLVAMVGLSSAQAGQGVGANGQSAVYEIVPTMKSKVQLPAKLHAKEALRAFRMLDAEDPSLQVVWEEALQEIHLHVMGGIQLDVLTRIAKDRFGYEIAFGPPQILYKETVETSAIGAGHFEPLGHYAEVHLRIEPAERGSGITFRNECHPDQLSTNYQHVIEQHLFERDHHGLMTGSPVTDVKITLLSGRAHNKHTSGGDFREASFRALRQGLEKASNVLLEPYYEVTVKVELDQAGRVMSDLQQAHGTFEAPITSGDKVIITGRVPVATFMNYSQELAAFTHGRGTIRMGYGGYDRCHNPGDVIAMRGYNKNADPSYSSSSIFCAKGQGYTVPWDEADAHMHVELRR